MVDLHIHSNFSDGNKSVNDIVNIAKKENINMISLTDHNTILNLNELNNFDIDYIKGIELHSFIDNSINFHLLAYDFNLDSKFLTFMDELKKKRYDDVLNKIIFINKTFGMNIDINLLPNEYLNNYSIKKYLLSNYDIDFVNKVMFSLGQFKSNKEKINYLHLIKTIISSNGIPVLAHPKRIKCDNLEGTLKKLVDNGLMGIEVYHSSHNKNDVETYLKYSKKFNLLISGGSDYHGYGIKNYKGNDVQIGKYYEGSAVKELSLISYISRRKNV